MKAEAKGLKTSLHLANNCSWVFQPLNGFGVKDRICRNVQFSKKERTSLCDCIFPESTMAICNITGKHYCMYGARMAQLTKSKALSKMVKYGGGRFMIWLFQDVDHSYVYQNTLQGRVVRVAVHQLNFVEIAQYSMTMTLNVKVNPLQNDSEKESPSFVAAQSESRP